MPRHGPPKRRNPREIAYKKRILSRKPKTRTITAVARRGQPQVQITVPQFKEQTLYGQVASSFISELVWEKRKGYAHMGLLNGYLYNVFIPFRLYQEWYWSLSKGTFFNTRIKGKYRVVRVK